MRNQHRPRASHCSRWGVETRHTDDARYVIAISGATTVRAGGYVFDKAVEQTPGTLVLGTRFFHRQVSACVHAYALAPVDDAGTHHRHLMVQRSCSLGGLVSQTSFWPRPLRKLARCLLGVIASRAPLCHGHPVAAPLSREDGSYLQVRHAIPTRPQCILHSTQGVPLPGHRPIGRRTLTSLCLLHKRDARAIMESAINRSRIN